jgi:ATP-dependent DNA helicase RecQ
MAAKSPRNISEFLEVSGVGEVKAERYGSAFLDEIAKYARNP